MSTRTQRLEINLNPYAEEGDAILQSILEGFLLGSAGLIVMALLI